MSPPLSPDDPAAVLAPAGPGEQWVVLHTKPRCEKKLVRHSLQREACMYLPTIPRVHNYGARVREYEIPLFNGYVFGRIAREDLPWFRGNPYVANLLPVPNETELLTALRDVAAALRAEVPVDVLPFLQPGRMVRVIGGPMKGMEAEIAEVKGRQQVILRLELIQQTVAMQIDAAYLQAAD